MSNKEQFIQDRDYNAQKRLTEDESNALARQFNDSLRAIPRNEVTFVRKYISNFTKSFF